ncbi:MAG: hypothetical protein RLZZ241_1091 [Bacteroidota bacterium]
MAFKFSTSLIVLLSAWLLPIAGFSQIRIDSLRTEYMENPMGLDVHVPRFSWQMLSDKNLRGLSQEAYQLIVADSNGNQVWDSGKVYSSKSHLIAYNGMPLKAKTRYSWAVTVWDSSGRPIGNASWFETGLLDARPDAPGWNGAEWIGGGDAHLQLFSHYLSVFKLNFSMQLDAASKSTQAGFVLGANDIRLQNQDLNIQGVASGYNGAYISFDLDIAPLKAGKPATLNVFRVGYDKTDTATTPFRIFEISEKLVNLQNQYDTHKIYLYNNFGIFQIFIDGEAAENEVSKSDSNSPFAPKGVNLNPVGSGNNYISFPMLADIGFKADAGQIATFGGFEIRNYREPSNVLYSEWNKGITTGIFSQKTGVNFQHTEAGFRINGNGEGLLITANPSRNAAPMLRTAFELAPKAIARARIYATARGIYEMYVNGNRVGDAVFTPGLTQYNRTHQYQTYDVTNLMHAGKENVLGAWLSEGWWAGNITYSGENWNYFGDRPSLRALLEITYEDGTTATVTTQPETWNLFSDGPLRYGSFFQGEVYDAQQEVAVRNWSRPEYDAIGWEKAVSVPLEGNIFPGLNYDNLQLIGQIGNMPTVVKSLPAKSRTEVRPGVFVYDMGQNMVGVPEIVIENGVAGDTVVLRYAEVLYPDLPDYAGNSGMIMLENIRAALTQDLHVLKGGPEVIRPRFTFHGYRFMELSGLAQAPPVSAVSGKVISSITHLDSHFETSDSLLNRFWENITWSLRANFLSIPTDTPARNERMGWSGDINVFSQAATYLAGVAPFLSRHLLAMRDIQREDGRFTDVAPVGGGFGGTLWGSAGIIIPWELYQQYGDTRVLEEHYDAMVRYVNFLDSKVDPNTGRIDEGPLGDWLSPENAKNDNTLLWTAYHAQNFRILAQTARILGKVEDASHFQTRFEERRDYLNKTYVDPENGKTIHSGYAGRMFGPPPPGFQPPKVGDLVDTQASYAIPLNFDLFDAAIRDQAAQHLASAIQRENMDDSGIVRPSYSLMTGFIGTAAINPALSLSGNTRDAYRLLLQREYPSWLYPVINGATTIWERLNSYTLEDGFGGNNSMNSFNHYSFGAVGAWMNRFVLGIERDTNAPGFQHFILQPNPDPDGKLTHADGYFDSPYGRIKSSWRWDGDAIVYRFTVPANTSATLILKQADLKAVTENGQKLKKVSGVSAINQTADTLQMLLASGEYQFEVQH